MPACVNFTSVILSSGESTSPRYEGIENALSLENTDIRIFNKPVARQYRRMGVALAYGSLDESTDDIRAKAKAAADAVHIIL